MALIRWSSRLSVAVAQFDNDHQKMVEMINNLHAAMKAGKGAAIIGTILDGLINYTSTHFAAEEDLMKKYDFPGLEEHKAQHAALVTQVQQIQFEFRQGKALPQSLMLFLKKWLMKHILAEDAEYGPFLNSRGVH